MPIVGWPPAVPGDVYFDVKEQPYTIWVCQPDSSWIQWFSMAQSRKCKHPEHDRILYPSVQRLAWVPTSGYDNYLRQTLLRMGKRNDTADTHIKIILDHERGTKPAPPPTKVPSPERAPSPDASSDGEVEGLVQQSARMDSDAIDDPTKSEAEIMEELRAVLGHRCVKMRVQNEDIQKAVATCSGAWYTYIFCDGRMFNRCSRT